MTSERAGTLTATLTALALGGTVVKAGNVIASKFLLNTMDTASAVFFRAGLAALWLVLFGAMVRRAPVAPWRLGRWGWLAAGCLTLDLSLFYAGCARTDASRAVLILNLQPFFVALFAATIHREDSLTLPKVSGMMLAFVGVAGLVGGDALRGGSLRVGDLLVMASAVVWAMRLTAEKRAVAQLPAGGAASLVAWEMTALTGACIARMLVTGAQPAAEVTFTGLYALLYLVLAGSTALVLEKWLLQRAAVSSITAFNFLIPVWGVLLSHVLLGEVITGPLLMSMVLVGAGIVLVNQPQVRFRFRPALVPVKYP